jgi:pyruvate dehydrogenase E1 component alpha subunit
MDSHLDMQERELWLKLYRTMVRVREFERAAMENYQAGKLPGFLHLSIGQEAVSVGACAALRNDDYMASTHRGHGDTIAKGVAVEAAMAELFGRVTGTSRAKGGSMHIADFDQGILGANGIVAAGIPIAVGAALSAQYRGTDQVALAFFGDGATGSGPLHEAMNMSSLWRLPMIFVRQNNRYAESTPLAEGMGIPDLARWAQGYGMPAERVDGNDVLAVYSAVSQAVKRARRGEGPSFVDCETYRWYGHNIGDPGTARPADEVEAWRAKDPVTRFRRHILDEEIAGEAEVSQIEGEELQRMHAAVAAAEAAPKPELAAALEDLYVDPVLGPRAIRGVRP